MRGESRTITLSPQDQEKALKLSEQMKKTLERYHSVLRQFSEAAGVRTIPERAILSVLPDGNLRIDW
jgi:hypothetical protein